MTQPRGANVARYINIMDRAGVGRVLAPPEQMQRERTIDGTFDSSGRMREDARQEILPPQEKEWWVPGTLEAGWFGPLLSVSALGWVARIRGHLRAAPIGSQCQVKITKRTPASGVGDVGFLTFAAGQTFAESPISPDDGLVGASTWLGVEIMQSAGAANLSLCVVLKWA